MASKIFFSHQKVYFWISAFDHRGIVVPKMHIVQCMLLNMAAIHFLQKQIFKNLTKAVSDVLSGSLINIDVAGGVFIMTLVLK